MAAIFLVGVLNLYSATHSQSHEGLDSLYKSQIGWFFRGDWDQFFES